MITLFLESLVCDVFSRLAILRNRGMSKQYPLTVFLESPRQPCEGPRGARGLDEGATYCLLLLIVDIIVLLLLVVAAVVVVVVVVVLVVVEVFVLLLLLFVLLLLVLLFVLLLGQGAGAPRALPPDPGGALRGRPRG